SRQPGSKYVTAWIGSKASHSRRAGCRSSAVTGPWWPMGQTAPMADVARQEAVIAATVDELWAVLVDFERYPSWAADLKQVEVLERDDEGRGIEVLYRAAAMGRSTTYVLRYDHRDAPHRIPW